MKKYRLEEDWGPFTKGAVAEEVHYSRGNQIIESTPIRVTLREEIIQYYTIDGKINQSPRNNQVENNPAYWEKILDNTPTDGTKTE